MTPDEYRRATGERVPSALQPLAALIGDEMSRARKIVEGMQDFSHEAFARAFVGGTEPLCIINDLQTKAASFLTGSGANYRSFTLRQARDTFATVSRNTGTREDVVSQLLAHSDLRTTKHYLGAFPEAEIEENARRIAGL